MYVCHASSQRVLKMSCRYLAVTHARCSTSHHFNFLRGHASNGPVYSPKNTQTQTCRTQISALRGSYTATVERRLLRLVSMAQNRRCIMDITLTRQLSHYAPQNLQSSHELLDGSSPTVVELLLMFTVASPSELTTKAAPLKFYILV